MKFIFKILDAVGADRICCFFNVHEYGKDGVIYGKHLLNCRVCKNSILVDSLDKYKLYGIAPKQYWEWKKKYFNWLYK